MVRRFLIAICLVLLTGMLCTREHDLLRQGAGSIVPQVMWRAGGTSVSPDEVDSVRFTVSSPELSSIRMATFAYADHAGKIQSLPYGISLTLKVEGLDTNGNVVYAGEVEVTNFSSTTPKLTIDANQVTPMAPDSLAAQALSYKTVNLTWVDRASN